ncbi:hypothetical protein DFH29DRAFT_964064 [Suillus ampliporus]|nr:hypothetical protein DFH29DRAFT_964064 [Suillus ampliporus]
MSIGSASGAPLNVIAGLVTLVTLNITTQRLIQCAAFFLGSQVLGQEPIASCAPLRSLLSCSCGFEAAPMSQECEKYGNGSATLNH